MLRAVADTHAVIWYLAGDPRLSDTARSFVDSAAQDGDEIGISAITLVEMVYLVEKGRIPAQRFSQLAATLDEQNTVFVELSINLQVARAVTHISVEQMPDMPDRIIAATAVYLNVPVISRDKRIVLSNVKSIWWPQNTFTA